MRRSKDDTHCVNGHPYTEENTRVRPDGFRACRQCGREGTRRYKRKRTLAAVYEAIDQQVRS